MKNLGLFHQTIIHKRYKIEKIPQKTTVKGTKVERGTIAPFKTEIEKPQFW